MPAAPQIASPCIVCRYQRGQLSQPPQSPTPPQPPTPSRLYDPGRQPINSPLPLIGMAGATLTAGMGLMLIRVLR